MINLFFSTRENRLRAGWRILAQLLLLWALQVAADRLLFPMITLFKPAGELSLLINLTIWVTLLTLSVFLSRRYLDRRSFGSLGLQWNQQTVPDLLAGFAIAGFLMGMIYCIEWAAGWLQFAGFIWDELSIPLVLWRTFINLLAFAILPSWGEELIDRGYRLQNLKDGLNLGWAILLTSAVFAARHLDNPNASWISTLGIFLAGWFLAYGWVRTRQLWLSLGIHAGWNFFECVVFGFPVSGFETFSLIQQKVSGPVLITGGAFGPEGGLILILALLVGAILIYWWSRLRVKLMSLGLED